MIDNSYQLIGHMVLSYGAHDIGAEKLEPP